MWLVEAVLVIYKWEQIRMVLMLKFGKTYAVAVP
jgi:hypothetical protein